MKTILLTLLCGMISYHASSQISITSANVPVAGTTYYTGIDNEPTGAIDPGTPGAAKTWDFTMLEEDELDTLAFVDPENTIFPNYFPSSNLAIQESDETVIFLENSSTALSILGTVFESDDIGDTVTMTFTPPENLLVFPTDYLSQFDNTFLMEFKDAINIPPVDSVYWKTATTSSTLADAWGDITIDMGTFPALRLTTELITIDSVWIHMSGFWILQESSIDTNSSYEWWSNSPETNYPIVTLDYSGTFETLEYTEYLKGSSVGIDDLYVQNEIIAYPNPASSYIYIKSTSDFNGYVELYDLVGNRIIKQEITGNHSGAIDISTLPDGVYFYKAFSNKNFTTGKFVVKK